MGDGREVTHQQLETVMAAFHVHTQNLDRARHHCVLLHSAVIANRVHDIPAALQTTRAAITALQQSAKELSL